MPQKQTPRPNSMTAFRFRCEVMLRRVSFMKNSAQKTYEAFPVRFLESRALIPPGNGGQAALFVVVLFVALTLAMLGGFSALASSELRAARFLERSKQSYLFAEGALEDAAFRLRSGKQTTQTIVYEESALRATSTITDIVDGKYITVIGMRLPAQRSIAAVLSSPVPTVFNYASQVGDWGLEMFSSTVINGNVFTNGSILGFSGSQINGNVAVVGSISSPAPVVSGTRSEGVDAVALPAIDTAYWESQANINNNPINGDAQYNGGFHTLGPRRINGSLSLNAGAQLTVTGPLYIQGDLLLGSNAVIGLDASFASSSKTVLVEGAINFEVNARASATGASPRGYLVLMSLRSGDAIELNANTQGEAIFYAPNGWVSMNSNSNATALAGKGVRLNANARLNYDLGLLNVPLEQGTTTEVWNIGQWGEI